MERLIINLIGMLVGVVRYWNIGNYIKDGGGRVGGGGGQGGEGRSVVRECVTHLHITKSLQNLHCPDYIC